MSSTKRKALHSTLNRRVRARKDFADDIEGSVHDTTDPTTHHDSHAEDAHQYSEDSMDGDTSDEGLTVPVASDISDDSSGSDSEQQVGESTSISFGALAKAQRSLGGGSNLVGMKSKTRMPNIDGWENNEAEERKAGRKDQRDFNRTSKHAPTEMSSKRAVTRKREIVPVLKRGHRDPRFDTLTGNVDESKVKRAYAFLEEYREDEMKALKAAIKSTKDDQEMDTLKSALLRMESRKKADDRKARQDEVLARHKQEEKELVKQGKQPFYLKEAEKKKRVLLEQYKGMKGGQLDHVLERRRKKVEGKEKKRLPYARRNVEAQR